MPTEECQDTYKLVAGSFRAQSAMEYLMTYGWAILIIAVVLATLFSIGAFNFSGPVGCIANPGFLCQSLVLNSISNPGLGLGPSITMNLGTTVSGWSNVFFVVAPQGQQITATSVASESSPTDILYWGQLFGQYNSISGLTNTYQTIPVTIYINSVYPPVGGKTVTLGTQISGTVWAMYSTSSVTNALTPVVNFRVTATN